MVEFCMPARYRSVERDQLMLLPYDLREWIPAGDIVHFVIEAAAMVPIGRFVSSGNGEDPERQNSVIFGMRGTS